MEISTLSQYGLSAIFIYWSWKLYTDMRSDSLLREQKLMESLEKITNTQEGINSSMKSIEANMKGIHERLCEVESCIRKDV